MALEQTLWFFKLSPANAEIDALAIGAALETGTPPPTALPPLPVQDILAALKSKFRRLKIDSVNSATLDLPTRETTALVDCRTDHIEVTFEGDADKTMEEFAKVLAKFECGCVYGNEYFPPTAPLGMIVYFYPDVEAEAKVFGRVRRQLAEKYPEDPKRQSTEMDRLYFDPTLRDEVEKLADELEAKYRRSKPPEVVARTVFQRFARVTRRPKVREKLDRPPRDTLARRMIEDAD